MSVWTSWLKSSCVGCPNHRLAGSDSSAESAIPTTNSPPSAFANATAIFWIFAPLIPIAFRSKKWLSSRVLGLGFLINRAARNWLIRLGDYERALACYRLTRALFITLGTRSNEAQSLIDQGKTYQAIGDRTTALTLYEEALDVMEADTRARPQLAESLRRRIIMLAASVYQLYLQQMNPDGNGA